MNTEVQISYNSSRPSNSPDAYRVSYSETSDEQHDLRQIGEVWNDVVRYRGVYATREEAKQAASAYRAAA